MALVLIEFAFFNFKIFSALHPVGVNDSNNPAYFFEKGMLA